MSDLSDWWDKFSSRNTSKYSAIMGESPYQTAQRHEDLAMSVAMSMNPGGKGGTNIINTLEDRRILKAIKSRNSALELLDSLHTKARKLKDEFSVYAGRRRDTMNFISEYSKTHNLNVTDESLDQIMTKMSPKERAIRLGGKTHQGELENAYNVLRDSENQAADLSLQYRKAQAEYMDALNKAKK